MLVPLLSHSVAKSRRETLRKEANRTRPAAGTLRATPQGPLNATDHPQRLQAVSSRHFGAACEQGESHSVTGVTGWQDVPRGPKSVRREPYRRPVMKALGPDMSRWVSPRRGQGEAATQGETHVPPSTRRRARSRRGGGGPVAVTSAPERVRHEEGPHDLVGRDRHGGVAHRGCDCF